MTHDYRAPYRGFLLSVDDSPKMQELRIRDGFGDEKAKVEHWQPFGFSAVPLAPQGDKGAEVVVAYLGGHAEHPVVIGAADRRHRPKNLKPGESAHHDDQGQYSKVGRGGIETVGKKVSMTAGDKPETSSHELNEQLKGMAARLAQAEQNLHGLFDVTSRLRAIAQTAIPGLSVLAPILNQSPTGLSAMTAAISGTAQSYLQAQMQQALDMFLNPNLAALTSVLSGAIESQIATARAQIAALITANPIVKTVDDLRDELAALTGSGGPQAKASQLQAQITGLIQNNPIVTTVDTARSQLAALLASAGPGLNFLEPQKRLVEGKTKSMQLS